MIERRGFRLARGGVLLLVALGVAVPMDLHAQDADFLFRTPSVSLAFYGGFNQTRAQSQVFDFTTDQLTVQREDFDAPAFRGEISARVSPRVDIALDVSWMRSEVDSETRDFIGTDDLPILQTTTLTQIPVSLNAKYYLRDRGRSIGQFAWIPSSWAPYVGGGAGFITYDFRQSGEFVNEETLAIVVDDLHSGRTGGMLQVLGGVEVSLSPRVFAALDARYRWGDAGMADDWAAFDDIDLSGFLTSIGLAIRL